MSGIAFPVVVQIHEQAELYLGLLCKGLALPHEKELSCKQWREQNPRYFHSCSDFSAGKRSDTSGRVGLPYSDTGLCLPVPVPRTMEPRGSSARGLWLQQEGRSQLLSLGFPVSWSESLPGLALKPSLLIPQGKTHCLV